MPPTSLCIVPCPMNRDSERARITRILSVALVSCTVLGGMGGCEQLDGRNRNRQGNRLFGETQFIDAVAAYQRALKQVDEPIIHYNAGLAYSKIFKPGFDGPILLGTQGEFVCNEIPGVKMVDAGACVKPGDRHLSECGAAKTAPLEKEIAELSAQHKSETDDAKKSDLSLQLKEKEDELGRYVCGSSFKCVETKFCSLSSPEIAELAAQHFQVWIKAQPSDAEIRKQLSEARGELDVAKKSDNSAQLAAAQRRVDDLGTKDQTRKLMTQLWIESDQYGKALAYWESLLQEVPDDPEIIGNLAGIHLKAGDWRKSIEWYNKLAEVTNDPSSKAAAYNFIGNVAWSRLNSRTLVGSEAIELADRGLEALQRGAELQPKTPKFVSLQASIFNFRSTAHGASWAAAIDRASAQDLLKLTRVLVGEAAKQAQQGQAPGPPPEPTPSAPAASPSPPAAGGSAEKSGG